MQPGPWPETYYGIREPKPIQVPREITIGAVYSCAAHLLTALYPAYDEDMAKDIFAHVQLHRERDEALDRCSRLAWMLAGAVEANRPEGSAKVQDQNHKPSPHATKK